MQCKKSEMLSIIIPVYNGQYYLEQCLKSIEQQQYQNYELIIVDDGSTDSSRDIISRFASSNAKIVTIFQDNSGSQIARNVGLSLAHGAFVAFVDADDFVYPEIYNSLINAMILYDADMAFCGYTRDEKYKLIDQGYNVIQGQKNILNAITGLSVIKCGGYLWNKVYRREILENIRFNEKINLGEDGLFNILLSEKMNRIVGSPNTFYFYRINELSLTNTHTRSYEKWEKECIEYENLLQKQNSWELRTYLMNRLLDCSIKGAEASIYMQLSLEKTKKMSYYVKKNVNLSSVRNKKTYIQAYMLTHSLPIYKGFIIIKKYIKRK